MENGIDRKGGRQASVGWTLSAQDALSFSSCWQFGEWFVFLHGSPFQFCWLI